MERSYRIADDGRSVACDATPAPADRAALADALAWRLAQVRLDELEDAAAVAELRALTALDDLLGARRAAAPEAPLSLGRDHAARLCEIAGSYVAARDGEGYQAPEERARIARLDALSGTLMDLCCELSAAEREAHERLPVR